MTQSLTAGFCATVGGGLASAVCFGCIDNYCTSGWLFLRVGGQIWNKQADFRYCDVVVVFFFFFKVLEFQEGAP